MSKPTVQQINESDLDEQEKYQLLWELGLIIETEESSHDLSHGVDLEQALPKAIAPISTSLRISKDRILQVTFSKDVNFP